MKPSQFDYDAYHKRCEQVNKKGKQFKEGEFLPVAQWTLGDGVYGNRCRDRREILPLMLDGITRTLEEDNDWFPYLEPWHGIGAFAQAFGCPFEWNDIDAPWTIPIISDIESLNQLEKPEIQKSDMLKMVLETTEYFDEQTKGQIYIAPTDTQGALSQMSLICDVTWMLTEAWDYPEEFHRALDIVTDLIIEFTLEQRKRCSKPAAPGHTMWSPANFTGISLSNDMLALVGSEFYKEFGLPYDQKIADALGGAGMHSCGDWSHNFNVIHDHTNVTMVDLAMSYIWDPEPNTPEKIIQGFGGTGIPIQIRCDYNDIALVDQILASDVKAILSYWWEEDSAKRKLAYEDTKQRWEKLKK